MREKPTTFEQARRIVEQVEREIALQAARARESNLRRFQPQTVPSTPLRDESPAAIGSRLLRLLGF